VLIPTNLFACPCVLRRATNYGGFHVGFLTDLGSVRFPAAIKDRDGDHRQMDEPSPFSRHKHKSTTQTQTAQKYHNTNTHKNRPSHHIPNKQPLHLHHGKYEQHRTLHPFKVINNKSNVLVYKGNFHRREELCTRYVLHLTSGRERCINLTNSRRTPLSRFALSR
jgi:hypothetical protein